jgi:hypothetical protein
MVSLHDVLEVFNCNLSFDVLEVFNCNLSFDVLKMFNCNLSLKRICYLFCVIFDNWIQRTDTSV